MGRPHDSRGVAGLTRVRKPLTAEQKLSRNIKRKALYWSADTSLREYNTEYIRRNPRQLLLQNARNRAKEKGLAFSITRNDIIIPDLCPLLNIPLERGSGKPSYNSPSLDRIDSTRGYTTDNIWVISYKANTIKNNSTIEEFEMLLKNWKIKLGRS